MLSRIPRFQIPLSYSNLFDVIKKSLFSGKEDNLEIISNLEKALADYIGTSDTFVVPSARLGLKLLLDSMGIGASDEIIVPAWTYFAIPSIIAFCKVKPVFVDIDPATCNMDISLIEKAITSKTKAIIATHLYGLPLDMDAIESIAKKNGLMIIEDCAQSFGASFDGRKTGSFGNAAFYSLGLTKNYTTIDGGLLATEDKGLSEYLKAKTKEFSPKKNSELLFKSIKGLVMKLGTSPWFFSAGVYPVLRLFNIINRDIITSIFDEVPFKIESIPESYFKSNINAVQASLGKILLDEIDDANSSRHANGMKLSEHLGKLEKIKIIQNPEKSFNIYLSFPIQCRNRSEMIKFLLRKGIDSTGGFIRDCPSHPVFKEFYVDCPNSKKLEDELLHIPVYPSLSENKILHIANSIKEYLS